ncbi:MAG TPA: NTP transferase domain-containing protein [Acidimicrobiales bacterium]
MTTAAVVLAAGAGTRFAGPVHKLLADAGGRPVVARAVAAAVGAGLDEVVVVTGAADLSAVLPAGVRVVHNPRWADGMATSLAAGVAAAADAGHDAVVVGLGDQPGVTADAWRAVAAAHAPIAVATYGGRRGHPVRLAAATWAALPAAGDQGARALMASGAFPVEEVPCRGDAQDVDTVEDLRAWS